MIESVHGVAGGLVVPWLLLLRSLGLPLEDHPLPATTYTIFFIVSIHFINGCVVQPMLDWGQHTESSTRVYAGVVALGVGTLVFTATAILFGASFNQNLLGTVLWAVLMSGTVVLPAALLLGLSPALWRDLFLSDSSEHTLSEALCYWGAVGGCVGAWCGAIPIPLDWDRPWQVWPIPCIYGAMLGYFIGTVGASIYGYFCSSSRINKIV